MSLWKILATLLFTKLFNIGLVPPQPPASKDELVATTKADLPALTIFRVQVSLLLQNVLGIVEAVTILAAAFNNVPGAQSVLYLLSTKTREAEDMHISIDAASIIGLVLMALAALVRGSAFGALGQFFKYDPSIQKNHALVTTGPYAYVRHPAYSGLVLSALGWCFWHGAEGSWVRQSGFSETLFGKVLLGWYVGFIVVIGLAVTLARMKGEDAALRKTFGNEWDEWAKKVPYFLIPGVY